MNAATRKKLLAYAIPIDLVVVATGIGRRVPRSPSVAIVAVYVLAVALSAWKSGWAGAIAAMVLSSVLLFFLFQTSVPRDQIGWLLAAGVVASIPLASLYASRVRRRLRRLENVLLVEPTIAGPQSIEEAAAEAIRRPRYAAEREAQARADSERIAAQRVAAQPSVAPRARQPVPMQRGIFSRFFHPRSNAPLKLNRDVISGESTANRRAAARSRLKKPEADAAPRRYDVICANCRVIFDAADADWCSCLTRDRTVVCTNCLTCFCKSAPAYKEIFWSNAPPQLLDRKAAELRRQSLAIAAISAPSDVR